MFNFFVKKKFLVDYLENFVDIHNHILPGIDDGAKNPEESIALIKGFTELGVTNFVATPHIMHNYYPNNSQTIRDSYELLENELLVNNMKNIAIEAAAEHMIDDNFELLLEENKVLPVRRDYILVEMSYLQASINFKTAIDKIASKRLFPILAHPERYIYIQHNFSRYRAYKKKGLLFQLNMLSLSDFYGKEVQVAAHKLLNQGLIDYLASDIHNLKQLNHLKEIRLSNSLVDKVIPIIDKTIRNFY